MRHVKLGGIMSPIEKMANVAVSAAQSAREATTRQSGTISVPNADGTRSILGVQNGNGRSMATHVGDVTPPGVPTGVTATSTSGMLTVHWDGTLDGGVPGDFSHVSVYIVDEEGSKSLLGSLSRAGDLTAAGLTEGATYEVTATAEDDACLADGTPAHNVSVSTEPIYVTIAASGGTDETARQMAQEAKDAANATSQSFWADGSGVHVSTEDGDPAGTSNVLINALGILLRAAQNNMLALTPSGITLYDGKGNADANVVATFTDSGVELGKNSMESVIKMCGGSLMVHTSEVSGSPYVDGLTWIGNTLDRSSVTMRGGAAVGLTIGGSEDEASDVYMGLQHTEVGVLSSPPVSIVTGVEKHVVSAKTVSVSADSVEVYNRAMTSGVTAPMSRLATAIQPVVLYNGGAALDYNVAPGAGTTGTVTLSETAANFRELTIFGKYGEFATSVTLTNPDGLTSALQLFLPNGVPATITYVKSRVCKISGTHITNSGWVAMWLSDTATHFDATSAPEIAITRVEGRR